MLMRICRSLALSLDLFTDLRYRLGCVFNAMARPDLQACSLPEIAEKNPRDADEILREHGIKPWMHEDFPEQVAELRKRGFRRTKNQAYAFRNINRRLTP